jgi:hypothetical protein
MWRRWGLIVALLVVGTGLLLAGWASTDYLQTVFANVGTAVLLVLPILLIERAIGGRIGRVEAKADLTAKDVETVRQEVGRTVTRLDELTAATEARIAADARADDALRQSVEDEASCANVLRALRRAVEIGAISDGGVRVEVPNIYERVRFLPGPADCLGVVVERIDGEELARFEWCNDEPPDALMHRVAQGLQRHNVYPGDRSFDASGMFEQLLRTLMIGIEHHRSGGALDLAPLVEIHRGGQWGDHVVRRAVS